MELPGAQGVPLKELDDSGVRQVCSQIGRRLNKLFSDLGEDDEIHLSAFSLVRESKKVRYDSGKSDMATFYSFLPAA